VNIECLTLGSMQVNCYVLCENGEAVVIDPGSECDKVMSYIEKSGCNLSKILLTHGHFDHIGAVKELAEKSGAEVYVHSGDAPMLEDNTKNLSYLTGEEIETFSADKFLDDVEKLTVGNSEIKVYYTPGHSKGSVSFLCGDNLFCGDLLFKGSIGRFDHGSLRIELTSLKFLMDNFSDDIKVFPGHGESTTIGEERRNNPYILNHVLD